MSIQDVSPIVVHISLLMSWPQECPMTSILVKNKWEMVYSLLARFEDQQFSRRVPFDQVDLQPVDLGTNHTDCTDT